MYDPTDRFVEEYADRLSYVRSIDGFLVKTSTLILELEDLCKDGGCDPAEYLRRILSDQRVGKYLMSFSCYTDTIIHLVSSDPRHRKLRKYLDIIVDALNKYGCSSGFRAEISVETPPALWVKESRIGAGERYVERVRPVRRKPSRGRDPEDIVVSLFYISIISLIAYVLIRLLI